eukprot:Plantae.Rhodophyta-Purpureofilum_apyrenoidigerum.ctg24313.p1 GENE.Plantae.Rhodophyta-Purpureofilum_apyrenoidigerum.ctg24313~~Plantae.Rhodophyta-Purpureofilum_apyrenoidigerum.ctg24313.p1  ORF type:complete len:660 (-),score=140.77 Plantae.Rhodophyta-Purpureofilum_apyrenoidigerum.ctg24313:124-2103(-)
MAIVDEESQQVTNGDAELGLADKTVGFENGEKYDTVDTDFDPFGVDDYKSTVSSVVNQPVHLKWQDLRYVAKSAKGLPCLPGKSSSEKVVLNGVSGEVYPGQILAIMGSSGAGKTTLLNLLAGRLTSSSNIETSGSVMVNGRKRDYSVFKRISAYVEQDDNMFAEVTVTEQIRFSANLRLPKQKFNEKQRQAKADTIITELGLSHVKDSYIGNDLKRGVSGGERKRVNIGTELVTDPSLIFLDEPTSGLDSFNALNVMHTLKHLAERGRTIVTTIHQPRSNIFSLFDKLLLLSGGRIMYFGNAADAVDYFSALNYRCPSNFNPADFFIDLISLDSRSEEKSVRSQKRVALLESAYTQHTASLTAKNDALNEEPLTVDDSVKNSKYNSSWVAELYYVMRRQFKAVLRAKEINIAAFSTNLIFSILLGLIWLNIGREFFDDPTAKRYNAVLGVIFFIAVNQAFGSTFSVIFGFPIERSVVLRERSSGTYRVSTYFIGKTLTELPRLLLVSLMFCVITYFLVGLREDAEGFFVFYFTVLLISMCAESLTIAIATLAKDAQVASSIVPVFMILALLFAGFFIQAELIPGFLRWIQYLSFIKYGLTAISYNQLEGTEFLGQFEEQFGNVSTATCYVVLVAEIIFFRLVAYIFLRLNGPKFDRSL